MQVDPWNPMRNVAISSPKLPPNISQWHAVRLTGITQDEGLSATPIGELEQIKSEMCYPSVVNVIAAMMERDIEVLDTQIEGKRAPEKAVRSDRSRYGQAPYYVSPPRG